MRVRLLDTSFQGELHTFSGKQEQLRNEKQNGLQNPFGNTKRIPSTICQIRVFMFCANFQHVNTQHPEG